MNFKEIKKQHLKIEKRKFNRKEELLLVVKIRKFYWKTIINDHELRLGRKYANINKN